MKEATIDNSPLVHFAEKHRVAVVLIFFALVLGLSLLLVHLRGVVPKWDGKTFEQLALNLNRYKTYTWRDGVSWEKKTHLPKFRKPLEPCADYAPLHPAVLALLISLSGGRYYIVGVANSLWLAGTVVFVFLLARIVSNDVRIPLISVILVSATAPFYAGLTTFYREPLYLFLTTGTAYFLVRSLNSRIFSGWSAAAGFMWGLSILTKPILILLIPFLWVCT